MARYKASGLKNSETPSRKYATLSRKSFIGVGPKASTLEATGLDWRWSALILTASYWSCAHGPDRRSSKRLWQPYRGRSGIQPQKKDVGECASGSHLVLSNLKRERTRKPWLTFVSQGFLHHATLQRVTRFWPRVPARSEWLRCPGQHSPDR